MTICYTASFPLRDVVIEYDRDAEWDSHWMVSLYRPDRTRSVIRRYASYTEARRAVYRMKGTS